MSPAEESNPLILENATSTAEAVENQSMSSDDQSGDDNCDDSKCDESNQEARLYTNAEDVQSEDAILTQDFTFLSDPAL